MNVYEYKNYKKELLTDQGQRRFLKARDKIRELLKKSGAFQMGHALFDTDSWFSLACVDRMVEIGELKEVGYEPYTQHKMFVEV